MPKIVRAEEIVNPLILEVNGTHYLQYQDHFLDTFTSTTAEVSLRNKRGDRINFFPKQMTTDRLREWIDEHTK